MTRRIATLLAASGAVLGSVLVLAAPAGAQSSDPGATSTSASNAIVLVVGVLLVTGVAVFITSRLRRRG